jgi:hypothetical protein
MTTFSSFVRADELLLIKRIYIAKEPFPSDTEYFIKRENRMRTNLRIELSCAGFAVVDDAKDADASLNGEYGEIIAVHGPPVDPPKYFYRYELVLSNKKRIWRTEVNLRTRSGEEWADAKACQRIVGKLIKAIEESKKNRRG